MKIKPCPFCGNKLEDIGNGNYFHSKTDECWLDKEIFDFADEDLLEEWNKRWITDETKNVF